MAIIQVLDEHIANQIAAGEVVERPASVVKELVENAIDAGSTRIDVTIEEGGLQLIRVKDNGSGIEVDDVETAFLRHATSKIRATKDLFAIRSLGFRGEALPSIAAVAKVELLTSATSDGLGRRFVIEGGHVVANEAAQAMQGTQFTVRELFFNTPARLKYMKTIQTELGHISDLIYRLALSYPNIAFTLKHNDNNLLQTIGNGDLQQVIAAIYGVHTAKAMIKLNADHLDFQLEGYVGKPELTRSNRNAMSWFVNGRYVRSFTLNQAVMKAYHTLLPINRYPIIVVHVKMHPSLVDVNVHPAKMEVRFSKETELSAFVEEAVRAIVQSQQLIPQVATTPNQAKISTFVQQTELQWMTAADASGEVLTPRGSLMAQASDAVQASDERRAQQADVEILNKRSLEKYEQGQLATNFAQPNVTSSDRGDTSGTAAKYGQKESNVSGTRERVEYREQRQDVSHGVTKEPVHPTTALDRPMFVRESEIHKDAPIQSHPSQSHIKENVNGKSDSAARSGNPSIKREGLSNASNWKEWMRTEQDTQLPPFPALSYIGQLHGTYLIANNEEGLYLIDQHAAHERINYEYYFEQFGKPADAIQELLLPLTLEFTPAEAARIRDRMAFLEQAGLILEPFGGQTFLVRAHPYWFPKGDELSVIQEMTDWVLNEKAPDIAKMREASAIMCSCKASIKANQRLSALEAETLLARLGKCYQPYTCPHGRPIVVKFTTHDLEKMFKRIM
ncbi:DNA mismatch repair endonuclease MutL [Paenibacillus sp. 481]|uniref:DNA mismatch repair endonuclease MutL n=1 Tax=Paenibacillus sp. 481 TaxID=2835869 RepID=UPI001E35CA4A|nr:DNA mismatch repair endonuclease MutL [Paenibacillus sp. 481]UHA73063.1 DNA mismatch repair endonuclease MutL [Paenibacillus sp. 481]